MTAYRIAYAKIQTTTTLDGVETAHPPSWYAVLFADDKRLDGYHGAVKADQPSALRSLAHLIITLEGCGSDACIRLADLPAEIQPLIQERLSTFHPTVRAKIAEQQEAAP